MPTVREVLNNGNPNSVPHAVQLAALGEALSLLPRTVRGAVASNKLLLPERAKAALLLSVYAIGSSSGYKTPLAPGSSATPSAGEVTIDAQGNIVFAAADTVTAAVVRYTAVEGEVFQEDIDVASNAGTVLGARRIALLLSATALAGTSLGAKNPVKPPTTPSAGNAAIGAGDDATVAFASADAVTRATVRYIALPGIGNTQRLSVGAALDLVVGGV